MKKVIIFLAFVALAGSILWVVVSDKNAVKNLQLLKERTENVIFAPTPTSIQIKQEEIRPVVNETTSSALLTKGGMPLVEEKGNFPIIYLTEKGFEPNSLTVAVGTVVRFQSKGNGDMLIVSDVHPDHTILPDLKQPQKGVIYDYTFTKVGRWTYHSESNPSQEGVVIVVSK